MSWFSRRGARCFKRFGFLLVTVIFLCAIPVLWVETQCMDRLSKQQPDYRPILSPEHRRNLVDSYLTYPEWSIVHAYEDFAGVTRDRGESGFHYLESITNYWTSLCRLSALASAKGAVTTDVRTMLYVIGISFTGEMGVKGLYEKTIGRFTQWVRGPALTPEDRFALKVAEDYAAFLRQTPWYEFPFGATLAQFWKETSWPTPSWVRSIERRISLSLEYGIKSGYAWMIAQGAALSPAKPTIRSIVQDGGAIDGMEVLERRADGSIVVETPRYRAFTKILLALVEQKRGIVEVAGNSEIFVTVLARDAAPLGQTPLLAVPLQAQPGWTRYGLSIHLENLPAFIQTLQQSGGRFEHAYDY